MRVHVALLGYLSPPGAPSTLLADTPTFTYYDAATLGAHPHGGPPAGGTPITIRGRSLLGTYVGKMYTPSAGYRRLLSSAE